jgi:hypothetical protein
VGDGGQQQREGGAVEAGGEVAQVDRLPVGERGGGAQQAQLAPAAADGAGAQRGVDLGPGDLRPEPLAVDVVEQADQARGLQLRQPVAGVGQQEDRRLGGVVADRGAQQSGLQVGEVEVGGPGFEDHGISSPECVWHATATVPGWSDSSGSAG